MDILADDKVRARLVAVGVVVAARQWRSSEHSWRTNTIGGAPFARPPAFRSNNRVAGRKYSRRAKHLELFYAPFMEVRLLTPCSLGLIMSCILCYSPRLSGSGTMSHGVPAK